MKFVSSCLVSSLFVMIGFGALIGFVGNFLQGYISTQGVSKRGTFPQSAYPTSSPSYLTPAIIQMFEHGYLIWRGDYNCVYALFTPADFDQYHTAPAIIPTAAGTYQYCLLVAPLPDTIR